MIAVDVNAIAYLWIPGEMTACAELALAKDPVWVSPILWRSEFRNILAGYLRRKELSPSTVDRCLQGAHDHLSGREYILPSSLVMACVARSNCSAYDCEYVALAEDLDIKLLTSDREVLREFPDVAVSLREWGSARAD
ncbi:MAG: type II toxin-antitoxin system VapC family toxin [Candidatus Aureabacteria bacterium]|nr:type II toxin-antitoxin system VapC family toxin [Candidatus Auribacterota bacterium]